LGHGDARLLADLSLARLRSGDAEAALASAEAAYRLQRASPVAAQARGMALAKLGRDPELAKALLDKAERIGGGNPLLKEARAQLRR
jgi:Flp pilus assembly protein TadD